MLAIVPKGVWHPARFSHDMTLTSVTPTHTGFVKLDVDDPRTAVEGGDDGSSGTI